MQDIWWRLAAICVEGVPEALKFLFRRFAIFTVVGNKSLASFGNSVLAADSCNIALTRNENGLLPNVSSSTRSPLHWTKDLSCMPHVFQSFPDWISTINLGW